MTRNPSLDGLRAIAVLAVVLFHAGLIRWGWIGVDLFFVLSGYLITDILLRAKATEAGASAILPPFYARRSLRILPLAWFAAIVVGFFTGEWHGLIPYVAYYSNWLPYPPEPHELRHYWTLAVEEQFYLLWPLAVLVLSRNALTITIVLIVAAAACFRVWLWLNQPAFATTVFLAGAAILRSEPLLMGALIAIYPNLRGAKIVLPFAACVTVLLLVMNEHHRWAVFLVQAPVIAATFGSILLIVLTKPPRWLSIKPLVWLGGIIRHLYCPWLPVAVVQPSYRIRSGPRASVTERFSAHCRRQLGLAGSTHPVA